MSLCVGFSYFNVNISNEKIRDIHERDTPPEMSLSEKIKDFFCFAHHDEALGCIRKLCHPPAGTTLKDVENTFESAEEINLPGMGG